jgi:hypothetical protein
MTAFYAVVKKADIPEMTILRSESDIGVFI